MNRFPMLFPCVLPLALAAVLRTDAQAQVAFERELPKVDGARLKATVVQVTYAPGDSSSPHRHPCPVIGYVIEGSYRTKSGDEPEATYTAGQAFYEAPGATHGVSANASKTRPVRFLAFFVCDTDAPLSAPVGK